VPEGVAVSIRGRSYKILADVTLTSDAHGVIFAHGSRFGGHALFIKDRRLHYVYNFLGLEPEQKFVSSDQLTQGKHVVGMAFAREKSGKSGESLGTTQLYIDEKVVADGPMRTQSGHFTLCGDGLCIGYDSADRVSKEYEAPYAFADGTILGVGVEVGDEVYLDLEKEAVAAFARD
jgi:arylsulfatase